jgi:two-component system nitrate/nitrite response regulator NarL
MRLVLCDGQRMLLDVLAPALGEAGHTVVDACSQPDVLPGLVARRRPDVCMLEAVYHGSSRLDAVAAVRSSVPDTVLVLLVAEAGPSVWRAYDDGVVDAVVSKSNSFEDVVSTLCAAQHGRGVVTGFGRAAPATPTTSAGLPVHADLDLLTRRERQVLDLLVEGLATTAIASRLGVSKNTVRTHVASVLRKLRVHDRGKAVSSAVPLGLA